MTMAATCELCLCSGRGNHGREVAQGGRTGSRGGERLGTKYFSTEGAVLVAVAVVLNGL